jgi:hypothetical protein
VQCGRERGVVLLDMYSFLVYAFDKRMGIQHKKGLCRFLEGDYSEIIALYIQGVTHGCLMYVAWTGATTLL